MVACAFGSYFEVQCRAVRIYADYKTKQLFLKASHWCGVTHVEMRYHAGWTMLTKTLFDKN